MHIWLHCDTTILATGKNFDETHKIIRDIIGVFNWSRTYNSPLEMNQLALIDFTQSRDKSEKSRPLILSQKHGGTIITHRTKPSSNAELLGVMFDTKLNWKTQHEKSPQMDDCIQPLHQECLGDRNERS